MRFHVLLVAGSALIACDAQTDPLLLKCDTYYESVDIEQTDYWVVDLAAEEIRSETEGTVYKITSSDEYRISGEKLLTTDSAFRVQLDRRTLDLALWLDMGDGAGGVTKYKCEVATNKKL